MSEWQEYRLEDVAKIKGRIGWKGYKTSDLRDSGPIVFSGTEIKSQTFVDFSKVKHLTTEKYEESPEIILKDKDIMVATRGSLGQIGFYKGEYGPATINPSLVIVSDFEGVPEFLFYYFISSVGQENILAQASGTTIPAIYQSDLKKIKIPYPPLETQIAIAEILSSLDDKIELNNKINQELENLAQTLFKQWFIDFEFPNENGEPYKSSGGEMVESELGEIPKGWEVGTIESLTQKMNSGGTPSTRNADYYDGNIIWYSTKELKDNFIFDSERTITLNGLNNSSAKLFPTNTVVMAIYAAPTVGRLGILSQESAFNQAALGFVAKVEVGYEFMYLLLKYLRDDFNNLANGAAQQNLNVGLVKNFKILMPLIEPLAKFQSLMKPVFESIKNNQLENNSLTKTRDTLLPKLISGELEINEIFN